MRATTATAVLLVRRMMLATTTITERLVRRTRVQDCYRDMAHAWRRSCGVAGSTDVNNAAGSDVCRVRTLSS